MSGNSIIYSLTATILTIKGTGIITQSGVASKGSKLKITSVKIEEGPTEIEKETFSGFEKLTNINIPKSVIKIGTGIFSGCSKLTKINVHNQNPNYCNDNQNFLYTKNYDVLIRSTPIKNPSIPTTVVEIWDYAFSTGDGFNYGAVEFPSTVSKLHFSTFDSSVFNSISFKSVSALTELTGFSYSSVTTLKVPNSITKILSSAMYYASIKTIIFEKASNLLTLEGGAFCLCSVSEVNLPDSLKEIQSNAFQESSVSKISIGSSCYSIATTAFSGCKRLSQVTVASSNIYYTSEGGNLASRNGTQLVFIHPSTESITLSASLTDIGRSALQNTENLTEIQIDGTGKWSSESGVLYSDNSQILMAVCGGVTSVDVNSNVRTIKEYAASGCKKLVTITFKGSLLKIIGNFAFDSTSIKSFILMDSVSTIGDSAFRNTRNLKTFTITTNSQLATVNSYCFHNSVIESFYFGKDIIQVGAAAFYYCQSLVNITFHADAKLTTFGSYAFEGTKIKELNLPSTITSIPARCFKYCRMETFSCKEDSQLGSIGPDAFFQSSLQTVVLGNKCKEIGSRCFFECRNLRSFKHQLTTIQSSAFSGCHKLENFKFSATQKTIDSSVFDDCINLISFSVSLSNSVLKGVSGFVYNSDETILMLFPPGQEMALIPPKTKSFADNAFYRSPKLKYVAFYSGSNLDEIGNYAFYECKQLKSVQLPYKLTHICSNCFYGCSALKSITFPDSLQSIDEGAFLGCKLETVKYCGNNIIGGSNVFESFVEVAVTDIYNGTTFCSNRVAKKLSVDCEFKPEFLPRITCNHARAIPKSLLFPVLILFSDF